MKALIVDGMKVYSVTIKNNWVTVIDMFRKWKGNDTKRKLISADTNVTYQYFDVRGWTVIAELPKEIQMALLMGTVIKSTAEEVLTNGLSVNTDYRVR